MAGPKELRKSELHVGCDPFDELAIILFKMTYGEMMELAEMIRKAQPERAAIAHDLPMLLHRWAKAHCDNLVMHDIVSAGEAVRSERSS
jgi:hypothetical protein